MEDSDQPAHPHSLIRLFTDCMCLLQSQGYPKQDKREPLQYLVDVHTDLSLWWLQRSYCRFCHALAHLAEEHTHTHTHKTNLELSYLCLINTIRKITFS